MWELVCLAKQVLTATAAATLLLLAALLLLSASAAESALGLLEDVVHGDWCGFGGS